MSFKISSSRKQRPRTRRAATILLLGTLALGCVAQPAAQDRTTMVAGITSDIETLNEVISGSGAFNLAVIRELFLSLADEQPDFQDGPLEFTPRLATDWEYSEDRLALTFNLRDDVVWSDGTPLTAEDVRFSWQAQVSEHTAYNYAFAKESIRDVEVIDPYTVRFHYNERSGTQFVDAVDGVILPKHKWGQLPFSEWLDQPEWFTENLVTSGPFLMENWNKSVSFELHANPLYYEPGLPKLQRILFRHVRETSSLFSQLLSGDLDFIQTMRPADIATAEARDDLRVLTHDQRQYTFVSWNTALPFFSEAEVRRALALAIDRQAIVDTIWLGYANVGVSPVLSSTWAAHPDIEPLPFDPELAVEILERHGWTDRNGDGTRDKDGMEFSFELSTNTGNPLRWDTIQMIQANLGEIGIEVRPARMDFLTINAKTQAHEYEAAVTAFLIDTTLDNSFAFKKDESGNFGQYYNEELEGLLDRFANAEDKFSELPTIHRIQEIIHEEQPITVLWEPLGIRGMSAQLKNVTPSSTGDLWLLRYWEWADD